MKRKYYICLSVCMVFVLFAALTAFAAGINEKAQYCLNCHGDYKDLAAKEPFYDKFNGKDSKRGITKVNPHRYWPHENVSDSGIPDCTKCHTPHKEDIQSAAEVVRPNLEACYTCHHMKLFDKCDTCHAE
ncbi:cytochrome c3 family protein [Seleniivibrio sp.]|uniref:cytochrome c3 family protein n=1 Tax=Seleniivibrio sp. TaxID=2898801 RepID=UPI0025FB8F6D|nr:cytochrome c3 family protein [Seleniivibrio sp.]MCD8553595.1 cytochrome c3 family protein [Seleniivibrio sp.]